MYYLLIKFCLGVVILLLSTQALVKLAKKLSQIIQISPLIIGTTIVALGTSVPELAVSTIASLKHDTGLALGNIIGSNIVNVLMVLPAGILIGKLRIGRNKTQRNALILLGVTALFVILYFTSIPSFFVGLFLIILALIVTVGEYELGVFGRRHEDSVWFKNHKKEKFTSKKIILIPLSIMGIILGSLLVVNSVESISAATGYSTTILGLSLTAIATSLPELLTTIFSQEEHQGKITIGNLIGSNIYNLLFIGGIVTFFSSGRAILTMNWVWLIATTIGFVYLLRYFRGELVPRWVGVFLLLLFIVYLATLI
jgi:cation:H+ antiporter